MLSTMLIVGFVGASFFSALALFAACVTVGRVSRDNVQVARPAYSRAGNKMKTTLIDVEWRMVDEQVGVR